MKVFLRFPALASQYPKVLSAEAVMIVGEFGDQCSSRIACGKNGKGLEMRNDNMAKHGSIFACLPCIGVCCLCVVWASFYDDY